MPKVLISDKMSAQAAEIFKKENIEVDIKTGLSPEELKEIIADYDGLAIRSSTKVTKEILAAAKNLKVIGRAGIGVDNIDVKEATSKGVIVMNTPFGNSVTTAEHAIAMMFAAARKIPQASGSTLAGKWEKSKFMGVEISNKTLGIIGCGNIGRIVVKKAIALDMKVLAYDPFLTEEKAKEMGVKKVELDELFTNADFITLHVPLTDETRNIVDEKAFKKMKNTAILVNCARGGLVNEKDLDKALKEKEIAAAALDVFEVEPAKENILFANDNLVATPHLGASTSEAQENVALQVAQQISNYLNSDVIENSLNIPALSKEDANFLAPFVDLAAKLASFSGQITENPITEIKVTYSGAVGNYNTKPLTSTVVKNTLQHFIEGINIVNSLTIAENRGITVKDVISSEKSNYENLIEIKVKTEKQTRKIIGTLFANEARIVKVNEVFLEAAIPDNLLFIKNNDKPGLIGEIGRVLGEEKINIANFHLGRATENDEALALVATDSEVSSKIVEKIAQLPNVNQVKALGFGNKN